MGVAEVLAATHVHRTIAGRLQPLEFSDRLLTELEVQIAKSARAHELHSCSRRRSIPRVGKILALVLRSEIPDIARFSRVQDFVSSARLVRCPKASAGTRPGSGNTKIGSVHHQWAFSEAACLFLRNTEPALRSHTRLLSSHEKAKALAILAQTLGRAVSFRLRRREALDSNNGLSSW